MTLLRKNFGQRPFPVLFDDAFFKDFFDVKPQVSSSVPAVNVKEDDKSFQVEIAAPGLKKEDFNISLDDNVLTISSEIKKENEEKDENGKYTRREFSYSSFSRSFSIDENHIDTENIKANYESGVLQLSIPKKVEVEKVKKTIEIQ
ncbi:MAG: Hsp20 family protein [Chitinophagales bacterium]|nr:Hsp20 family protein [Chitinophagales bacterium]